MWEKNLHLNKKSRLTFNSRKNLHVFYGRNFIKVNWLTSICATRNCQLFLILTNWNIFKFKNLLQKLDLYKIPAKELHLLDGWAADVIRVS